MDAAMASLLILQTAVDEGLGSCFFGIPPDKVAAVREAFSIPDPLRPGRRHHARARRAQPGAPGSPSRRRRKDTSEVVHHGRWSEGGHKPG